MGEVLLDLCANSAPRIARAMHGYKKDAQMLCNRVVKENVGDMIDAASLGEDMNMFCKENKICPLTMKSMMKMAAEMVRMSNEQAEKEAEREDAEDAAEL